jgi:hypothetical protein
MLRDKQDENRIASPEMFPEAEMLPHLICSRPIFIGGAKDEVDLEGAEPLDQGCGICLTLGVVGAK